MENMPIISQLSCTSGSSLPLLFQPVSVLLRDTSTGWDKVGALCSCWVGRAGLGPGLVVGCAESHPDLSQGPLAPVCHHQSPQHRDCLGGRARLCLARAVAAVCSGRN